MRLGTKKVPYALFAAAGVLLAAAGIYLAMAGHFAANTLRDEHVASGVRHAWAQRLDRPGLSNFHRVSNDLYRGAQPTAEGFGELEKMGIKTVVNLRESSSDRDKVEHTSLACEEIASDAWNMRDQDVIRFLRVVGNESRTPVFVHCRHGADRTGTMTAICRIVIEGWTKEEAIQEMTQGGFGFHRNFTNLIEYIRNLDVDEIRRQAGLAPGRGAAPAR